MKRFEQENGFVPKNSTLRNPLGNNDDCGIDNCSKISLGRLGVGVSVGG
jgi:hypothetical protein